MVPIVYLHPFSSYCQKVIAAFYDKGASFDARSMETPGVAAELKAVWPLAKFPVLAAGELVLPEATIIIEWLDRATPDAPRLIPGEPEAAQEVRLLDRLFDNYVMTPMQRIVADRLRDEAMRDPHGVAEWHGQLKAAYAMLEARLAGRRWAAGEDFTLADLAAAPSLFYADWVEPIGEGCPWLRDYRTRLLARPSVARAVDEARPYRHYFPGGAPDRD